VDTSGTRPITLLNEVDDAVTVFYTTSGVSPSIAYKQSSLSRISFDAAPLMLMSDSSNNVSSMKDNVIDEAVVISSGNNNAYGAIISPAPQDPPTLVNFYVYSLFANRWAEENCAASNDCDGRDFDLCGSVDIKDLRIFVNNWLSCF
jgi:hypothetical protein